MSETLFGRTVILELDNQAYRDFRVDFDVTKTLGGSPNEAKISIYNVDYFEGLVERAQSRDLRVRLLAGYDIPKLIFEGNPIPNGVDYERDGVDNVLTLEAKDGYNSYKRARLNTSFSTQTSLRELIDEAAGELGIPTGTISVPNDIQLTQGGAFSGQASDLLDRLADSAGADWSIQDGALQFLPANETNTNQGPLFSTDLKNLISYSDTDYGVKIKTILHATINPGDKFKLEHPDREGSFKARKVQYTGSRWQNDFYTTIEAEEYKLA